MEELLAKHRKEQRDLQSKITQKKKSASKKTRKGVNDECATLEQELKVKQEAEVAALSHKSDGVTDTTIENEGEAIEEDDGLLTSIAGAGQSNEDLDSKTASLRISPSAIEAPDSDATTQRKPNRQKARLARRAADQEAAAAEAAKEAANLPDLKAKERAKMTDEFRKRGLQEKVVAANGHCMYLAVADQMRELGLDLQPGVERIVVGETGKVEDYKTVRRSAADYITGNPDDFAPFLEEPLEDYVHKIRDTGEWGGQLELMALAKTYNININVLQGEGRIEKIEGATASDDKEIWLAYYRHGFGLGEHYNSLRKAPNEAKG